ncbi:Ethylene receptor [Quillaja saponaria]|uniref:Ethylene receptor n=1 Tax=Quillaja saponaria TaxID=32244 RepID=A0AAD7QAZ3_QUISA|nr:Ethylene receptor [Quillaja saponaria]
MMQGNIWISPNTVGFAQSMTLLLRFQLQSSFGRAMFAPKDSPEHPNSNSQFRGLKIVLADDDDVNRMVTKKLLEKLGCQVTAVSSGFECLSALSSSENSSRLILLDLQMPDMDGFEVATRIRKFRSRNWPLIIALTASAEDNVWERCLHVGMNGVIRKPVLLQGIADELRRVLHLAGESL